MAVAPGGRKVRTVPTPPQGVIKISVLDIASNYRSHDISMMRPSMVAGFALNKILAMVHGAAEART